MDACCWVDDYFFRVVLGDSEGRFAFGRERGSSCKQKGVGGQKVRATVGENEHRNIGEERWVNEETG